MAKKDLNKLSVEDLKKELELLEKRKKKVTTKSQGFYQIGESYFIRTITMYYTGRLIKASEKELVLTNCAWIADTGNFTDAMANGNFKEIELFPTDAEVIINREALLDMHVLRFELPTKRK